MEFLGNLCQEIQMECKRYNIVCHANFIQYYLRLLALNPLWNLTKHDLVREDAIKLINFCVEKMRQEHCPCLIAVKMQCYFECNFETMAQIGEIQTSNLLAHLRPLVDEIIEAEPTTDVEYDKLKKQIAYYCVLFCNMGNPTVDNVYWEQSTVLFSIFSDSELKVFVRLGPVKKRIELNTMAVLSAGIRVFNWADNKGKRCIEDVMKTFLKLFDACSNSIDGHTQENMLKLDILTSVIDNVFVFERHEKYRNDQAVIEYTQVCVLGQSFTYEEIEHYKDLVIIFRMVEQFHKSILKELENLDTEYDDRNAEFTACVYKLQSVEGLRYGVLMRTIAPLFAELQRIWSAFQLMSVYVHRLLQITTDINIYVKDLIPNYERLEEILDGRDILSDEERLCTSFYTHVQCPPGSKHLSVVSKSLVDVQKEKLQFEFAGFDVWRMVESQGGLIPGNPTVGIVTFKDHNYIFSRTESLEMFLVEPELCINGAYALARSKVELIPLLHLEKDLAKIQTVHTLIAEVHVKFVEKKTTHIDTQTLIHPKKPQKDISYTSSLWEHKRQALRLADMINKQTKSTMTMMNASQGSVGTQTTVKRDFSLQTRKDAQSNTRQCKTFLYGLRGRKDDKQFVLDLTRPMQDSSKPSKH